MNYKIGFITSNTYLDFELDILLQGTNFIVIDYTMLTHNVVEYCHHKGVDVFSARPFSTDNLPCLHLKSKPDDPNPQSAHQPVPILGYCVWSTGTFSAHLVHLVQRASYPLGISDHHAGHGDYLVTRGLP